MSQSTFTRSRTQPTSFLNGNFPAARISRTMLLKACDDVEFELRRMLRRQRWSNLVKLLRKVIHF